MLKTWTVRNFKSIRDETLLDLAALTVFAGANSSGKSTLLQSILLTAQTLGNPVSTREVVLNGRILRLGGLNDLGSHKAGQSGHVDPITIGFSYSNSSPDPRVMRASRYSPITTDVYNDILRSIRCSYTFSTDPNATTTEQSNLQPIVLHCKLQAIYRIKTSDGNVEEIESSVSVSRSTHTPQERAQIFELNYNSLS